MTNDIRTALSSNLSVDDMEAEMLEYPQTECPVAHHFGPGVYIREVTIPSGTLVIGHAHKHSCLNVLVKGKMALLEGGVVRTVEAPMIFTTPPGRKMAYVIDEVVFQNIHATDETDVHKLEEQLVDKSAVWEAHQLEHSQSMLLSAAGEPEG